MKIERYRNEFIDVSFFHWLKNYWPRPRYHIVLRGNHNYELIDMKTGYYNVILVDKNLWKLRRRLLWLMLTTFSR